MSFDLRGDGEEAVWGKVIELIRKSAGLSLADLVIALQDQGTPLEIHQLRRIEAGGGKGSELSAVWRVLKAKVPAKNFPAIAKDGVLVELGSITQQIPEN